VGDVYYFAAVGGWNRKNNKKQVEDLTIFLRHYAPTNPSKFSTSPLKFAVQNCRRNFSALEARFAIRKEP
jgi:hypothetical protein